MVVVTRMSASPRTKVSITFSSCFSGSWPCPITIRASGTISWIFCTIDGSVSTRL